MNMKKIAPYFGVGCLVAIIGLFFSDICGNFFNGMDYGSACVLGIAMYLCIVVVTCTGVIVSKLEARQNEAAPKEDGSAKKDA